MSETLTQSGFTQEAFEAFQASRDEPSWLSDLRRRAWEHFIETDWPARNEEQWRRTDIRLFRLERFSPPSSVSADLAPPHGLLSEGVALAGSTSSVDGRPCHTDVDTDYCGGAIFGSLDRLVGQHSETIRQALYHRVADPTADRFAALQAAFWSGGKVLYVPRGVSLARPFSIISAIGEQGVDLSHTLIVLEEGAEATVLEETLSTADGAGLHCGAVEVLLGPGSRLRYVNLQNWGPGVWHFARQQAVLDRDARLQWTIGALGSKLSKVNQDVTLAGPGAEAQVNGVMFTEGRQHLSYHTRQNHQAPHCRSDLLYKAALQDSSRVVWRGMIKVDPDAQRTDGYQRNDNLVLSDRARADSIPGLEIEADDVRCTHGSTTGRVDDELIFYARTRGITRNEAVRMIVAGFFQQVFDRITIESVREALGHAIRRRIRDFD